MKRTPITRKTRLQPGKQQGWNSTLRPMSKKRQNQLKATAPLRRRYVENAGKCQAPRCNRKAWDCHEITRGTASRYKAVEHRETFLALCRTCHEAMGDYSVWPIEKQLALKLLVDPAWFDLEVINSIRGRSSTAIELVDVACYLEVA